MKSRSYPPNTKKHPCCFVIPCLNHSSIRMHITNTDNILPKPPSREGLNSVSNGVGCHLKDVRNDRFSITVVSSAGMLRVDTGGEL